MNRERYIANGKQWLGIGALALIVLSQGCANHRQNQATAWQWGAGSYTESIPANCEAQDRDPIDSARWDWVTLSYMANGLALPSSWDGINRQLAMNPKQKIMIDIFFNDPEGGWGDPKREGGNSNVFDYRYKKGAQAGLEQKIRDRVNLVIKHCSRPENIVGFVLVEEIPNVWGCTDQIAWAKDPHAMPPIVKEFQDAMEADPGLPAGCKGPDGHLQWNEATKRYVGQVYAECLRRLFTVLRRAMNDTTRHPAVPNAKVVFWNLAAYLDDIPQTKPGADIWTNGFYPAHWTNFIFSTKGERLVDVIYGGGSGNLEFFNQFVRVANAYNLGVFLQLWHPGRFNLYPWSNTVANARLNDPRNLGYFFYCEGNCNDAGLNPEWCDPSLGTNVADSVSGVSRVDHARRFGAQDNVGMDLVRRELAPFPMVQVAWSNKAPGEVVPLTVLLENPATADWFTNANEAVAQSVVLNLTLPANCTLDPAHAGQALSVNVGHLAAKSWRKYVWWVKVKGPLKHPVTKMRVTSANRPVVSKKFVGDSAIPAFQEHAIRRPSKTWFEHAIGSPRPLSSLVTLEALHPVDHPSLAVGVATQTYDAVLMPGQTLQIQLDGTARLRNGTLLSETEVGARDSHDPTGYRPFASPACGNLAKVIGLNRNVTGMTQLVVTVSGKVADGGVSVVGLTFRKPDLSYQSVNCMWGTLGTNWTTRSETVVVPEGVSELYNVYFCCGQYPNPGSVYYGTIKVENRTYPDAGIDVSSKMQGTLPAIPADGFNVVTYSHRTLVSGAPVVRVQFQPQAKE